MQNTLNHPQPSTPARHGPSLMAATVTGQADKWFFICSTDAERAAPKTGQTDIAEAMLTPGRALRAESCLLQPECGDTVLVCSAVAVGVTTVPYILAVLSRIQPAQGTLVLPGGAHISADQGLLQIDAAHIHLNGSQSVAFKAPQLEVVAAAGKLRFSSLDTTISECSAQLGALHMVAQSVHSTVARLVQKATNSFRWTSQLDETRAGRMRLAVTERFALKAQHASVIAEGQVKIDGEKIDLG